MNMPVSSKIAEEINGYVATKPLVKIFLLEASFTSVLLSIRGNILLNPCSCLKYALIVCIPLLCKIPSILFNKYSNSFSSVENVFTYMYKKYKSSLFTCISFLIYLASLYVKAAISISCLFLFLPFKSTPTFPI